MADKKTFKLEVVTPKEVVYSEEVERLIVRTTDGDLGVLPGHTHLVTGLQVGVIRITKDRTELRMAISGGFIEITPTSVALLTDTAEKDFEIDVERAYRAKEKALEQIRANKNEEDILLAEISLRRAVARLKAVGKDE